MVMALQNADPAFLGTRSGDDDMKSVTTVTLHQHEGGNIVCRLRCDAEEGQQLTASRQASVVWHRPPPHHVCLDLSHTIEDDREG